MLDSRAVSSSIAVLSTGQGSTVATTGTGVVTNPSTTQQNTQRTTGFGTLSNSGSASQTTGPTTATGTGNGATTLPTVYTPTYTGSGTFTYGGHTYTVSGTQTFTITDCSCTDKLPDFTSVSNSEQQTAVVTYDKTVFTTYCPESHVFTYGGKTYTATEPTTMTITGYPGAVATDPSDVYITVEKTIFTTYCPEAGVFTHGGQTYTVTEPTTVTITDYQQINGNPTRTANPNDVYVTVQKTIYTTYYPEAGLYTYRDNTYTVTEATTVTVTEYPEINAIETGSSNTGNAATPTEKTTFTTYCPGPETFTYGGKTYTVTEATTVTITESPEIDAVETSSSSNDNVVVTAVQTTFTTYCPKAEVFTFGGKTYTATGPTTMTITGYADDSNGGTQTNSVDNTETQVLETSQTATAKPTGLTLVSTSLATGPTTSPEATQGGSTNTNGANEGSGNSSASLSSETTATTIVSRETSANSGESINTSVGSGSSSTLATGSGSASTPGIQNAAFKVNSPRVLALISVLIGALILA